jgi:hypothetical protein
MVANPSSTPLSDVWAAAKFTLGEIAIHAEYCISLGETFSDQESVNAVRPVEFLELLSATPFDMVQAQELDPCFPTTPALGRNSPVVFKDFQLHPLVVNSIFFLSFLANPVAMSVVESPLELPYSSWVFVPPASSSYSMCFFVAKILGTQKAAPQIRPAESS